MPALKFRSKKSAQKRFKILSRGIVKHHHAYTSHLAYSKSTKQKRHLRKDSFLDKSDWKRLKKMLTK